MLDCDAIVVPNGGGGLVAGIAVAANGLRRGIQVGGVQALKITP
jgi:threonine dehydratase